MKVRIYSVLALALFMMGTERAEIKQMDITVFGMD